MHCVWLHSWICVPLHWDWWVTVISDAIMAGFAVPGWSHQGTFLGATHSATQPSRIKTQVAPLHTTYIQQVRVRLKTDSYKQMWDTSETVLETVHVATTIRYGEQTDRDHSDRLSVRLLLNLDKSNLFSSVQKIFKLFARTIDDGSWFQILAVLTEKQYFLMSNRGFSCTNLRPFDRVFLGGNCEEGL